MIRKMLWLDEHSDEQAIRIMRERYGCESDGQAGCLALRALAAGPILRLELHLWRKQ